jgi:hypothetical protein
MSARPILSIAGKEHPLKWSLRAHYRLQSIDRPSTFADLLAPDRAVAASLNFGWACLPSSAGMASPEALADALEAEADGRGMERLDDALSAALEAAFPQAKAAEVKNISTDSSPAPASSSG